MPTTPSPADTTDSPDGAGGGDLLDPGRVVLTEPSPAVDAARALLLLLADTTPDPVEHLVASAALARLSDVHPPYAPAAPSDSPVRGAALTDEAIGALITAADEAGSAHDRARALSALEELSAPLDATPALQLPPR